jgi:hypothetical protein
MAAGRSCVHEPSDGEHHECEPNAQDNYTSKHSRPTPGSFAGLVSGELPCEDSQQAEPGQEGTPDKFNDSPKHVSILSRHWLNKKPAFSDEL